MTAYLVTGGAGFVGSHLVEALVKRGNTVRVVDNLSTGTRANLAAVRDQVDLIIGDLHDLDLARRALTGMEVVFHQAASMASEAAGAEGPTAAPATDTFHVLIAAKEAGVRRVVYASCASVYGEAGRIPVLASDPVTESAPTDPSTPRAVAKLIGEQHCVAFTSMYGLDTVRLRYFNVFGPRQSAARPGAEVIAVLEAMLAGQKPVIPEGAGKAAWDMIYVADVVYANLLAADLPRGAGKVFNIGRGRATTLLDIVAAANAILGTAIEPLRPVSKTLPAPLLADVTFAETHLGLCASTDLEHALRQCLVHYQGKRPPAGNVTGPPTLSQEGAVR